MNDITLKEALEIKKEISYFEQFEHAVIQAKNQDKFSIRFRYCDETTSEKEWYTSCQGADDLNVNTELAEVVLEYIQTRLKDAKIRFEEL